MHSVLLLVGDDQLRASLEEMLTGIGKVVVSARNVAAALESEASRTATVAVSEMAPDKLAEGVSTLQMVREHLGLPVVLLTPLVDAHVLAMTAGLNPSFVVSPVVPRELAAAIEIASFRRHADRQIASRERWYRTTLRCIADAVITADDDARITFMNPTAEQLTGWTEADALGLPLNDVFSVKPDAGDGSVTENGAPVLRLSPRAGASLVVEHNAAPIVEDSGALHGVVVVFRDVTERRRLEQRLALSDRMASIGTLAAGIAHELNNPLAFVTSNIEFAIQELERLKGDIETRRTPIDTSVVPGAVPDSIEALVEARDGASRAAAIVRDMKVFMRGDSDPSLVVDVNRAVSLAVRLTGNEIRHQAEMDVALGEVPSVLADEGKLVQVIVAVLTNAVQSLDDKRAKNRISVSSTREGDRIVIRVQDTGRGIPPENLGRIFEPFFTTKPVGEGLGLGLSIAHQIVASFRGTITASSQLGRGTVIVITLPSSEAVHAAERAARAQDRKALRGRVLVIDDEALIGTAIRRILTKQGIDVTVEGQGRAAFERFASGERFDVVLCDLMMPGFSGVDLYESLDAVAPEMKSRIVFMTGNAFTPKASALFETTSNVRLEKPFVPSDLTRAIVEVMRRHGDDVSRLD